MGRNFLSADGDSIHREHEIREGDVFCQNLAAYLASDTQLFFCTYRYLPVTCSVVIVAL
jgi:hypothetical protein